MPERKSSSKVVSQQPAPIVHAQKEDDPIPPITITVHDPGAIAYAVAAGVVGAILDRLFGGQSNHE